MKNATFEKVVNAVTEMNHQWLTYEEIDSIARKHGTTAPTIKKYSRMVERVIPWNWGEGIDLKTKKIYQVW